MAEGKLDLSKLSVENLFTEDPLDTEPVDPTEGEGGDPQDGEGDDPARQEPIPGDPDPKEGDEGEGDGGDPGDGEEGKDEESMFAVLQKKLGYEIEGEFSEDYDGMVEFTKQVAGKMINAELDGIFQALPDVGEYMQYRLNGGDPKAFFENAVNQTDFSALELKEDDETSQSVVVAELLRMQGYTNEEIKETIEDYKDTGILYKQATKAKPKVVKAYEDRKMETLSRQAEERKQKEEDAIKEWKEIQDTIAKGNLQGFTVPEAEKKAFFDWMAVPVDKEGRSQRILARENMSREQFLALEFLLYKGFDLNKLVQNTKNTQQATNLRAKLQQSKPGASDRLKTGGKTSARGVTLPGLNDLF